MTIERRPPSPPPILATWRSARFAQDKGLVSSLARVHAASKRAKAQPWSEEEHLRFLMGLQKLGKGNWSAVSRYYVPTRTPAQVLLSPTRVVCGRSARSELELPFWVVLKDGYDRAIRTRGFAGRALCVC